MELFASWNTLKRSFSSIVWEVLALSHDLKKYNSEQQMLALQGGQHGLLNTERHKTKRNRE